MTLSTTDSRQVFAYSKASGTVDRCFDVARNGKAVHFEFSQDGSRVWVSDWAVDGALVVLDGSTLEEVARLGGLGTLRRATAHATGYRARASPSRRTER